MEKFGISKKSAESSFLNSYKPKPKEIRKAQQNPLDTIPAQIGSNTYGFVGGDASTVDATQLGELKTRLSNLRSTTTQSPRESAQINSQIRKNEGKIFEIENEIATTQEMNPVTNKEVGTAGGSGVLNIVHTLMDTHVMTQGSEFHWRNGTLDGFEDIFTGILTTEHIPSIIYSQSRFMNQIAYGVLNEDTMKDNQEVAKDRIEAVVTLTLLKQIMTQYQATMGTDRSDSIRRLNWLVNRYDKLIALIQPKVDNELLTHPEFLNEALSKLDMTIGITMEKQIRPGREETQTDTKNGDFGINATPGRELAEKLKLEEIATKVKSDLLAPNYELKN